MKVQLYYSYLCLQVLRFLRPNVTRDSEGGRKVVAVYLSDAATYYAHPNEDLLRQHIKKVGKTNVPIDFLRDTSRDTIVLPRKNGKKKKCAVIPHNPCIPEEILQELYRGMKSHILYCPYVCDLPHTTTVAGVLSSDDQEAERRQEEQRRLEEERRQEHLRLEEERRQEHLRLEEERRQEERRQEQERLQLEEEIRQQERRMEQETRQIEEQKDKRRKRGGRGD